MSTMAADEAPLLLADGEPMKHDLIYQRFGTKSKRIIVGIVSWGGLLPLLVSGSFIPSVPQIAKDLDTTPAVVTLAISLSVFAMCLGPLIGATYSTFYGRRSIYLFSLPLLVVGSIGVAASKQVPELMVWRFFQALGAAPGLAVGAAVVGDIYKLEERGRAMAIFFVATLLGPAFAPLVGGIAAHYASWRIMQLSLGVSGALLWFLVYAIFPETSHPGTRGLDKALAASVSMPKWRPILINPFRPLQLLRSPNLLFICLVTTASLFTYNLLLVPLAYTIGARYQIDNEAIIGACFLPAGLGNMIAAPIVGRISDMNIIAWKKRRNGVWYPEDRLRPALVPLLTLVPMSVLVSGILSQFVGDNIGLVLNLVCLFINGFGVEMVWGPCAAYIVDVMHTRSAEGMAANNGLRSAIMSIALTGVFPMIDSVGVAAANGAAAWMAWMACALLWCTIKYGDQYRAYVDVGFSTANEN